MFESSVKGARVRAAAGSLHGSCHTWTPTTKGADVNDEPLPVSVLSGLLEAIGRVSQLFDGASEDDALRDSFQRAARALGAQRAFLARVHGEQHSLTVIESVALTPAESEAVCLGRSSPGLSVSLVRRAILTGCIQHLEDTRLAHEIERTRSLMGGEWSVVCAPVADPYTRAPLAVLYFQTHSVNSPLTLAHLPHVQTYVTTLSHVWRGWTRAQQQIADVRAAGALEIVGESDFTANLRDRLHRLILPAMAAARPDPILILGDTGTGKDLLARYLHAFSARSGARYLAANCALFRGELMESTLFGHVRGAFTGALDDADGLFFAADGGVLFLDEVGNMPWDGQNALLRAIETRCARPVGAREERPFDVQLVCATNADLQAAVRAGTFRKDLYHRIKGLQIRLPPLTERRGDVLPLLAHFLAVHERRLAKRTLGLSDEACNLLLDYRWPGNVRELDRACSLLVTQCAPGATIDTRTIAAAVPEVLDDEPDADRDADDAFPPDARRVTLRDRIESCERRHIARVGRELNWNQSAMAECLGLHRKSLYRRMVRHGLQRPSMRGLRPDSASARGHAE